MLKLSRVELELLICPDAYLFLESTVREGISVISNRYACSNNPFFPGFDVTEATSYIGYYDANNLYAKSMKEKLHSRDFLNKNEISTFDVMAVDPNSDKEYFVECDDIYPESLHDSHAPFSLEYHESRLDYCNSLLSGINKELLNRLESVLWSAARSVMRKRKFDPISEDIRNTLHWLPVHQRIEFKLGILAFKCLHGDAPSYLTESLSKVAVNPALQAHRSATRADLVVPQTRIVKMGPRSFRVSGPMLWNSLPLKIRYHKQTLESFKAKLKTYLFKKAYFS